MARELIESSLTTPAARDRLSEGVHWRRLDPDTHLGYRKGKRGGVWLVRWRSGGAYTQVKLDTADDLIKAGKLSYAQAEAAARAKVEGALVAAKAASDGEVPTVRSAVQAYAADRDARDSKRAGRPKRSDASQRLGRYVLGQKGRGEPVPVAPVADVALHELKETHLREWLTGLPAAMKSSTKERLATDLKAALNAAYDANHEKLPAAIPAVVKRGLRFKAEVADDNEIARDNQILGDGQVTALLAAARAVDAEEGWEGDLFRLIVVLAATGMRFSQVARLRVRDVQRENRRLLVPVSRKGKGSKSLQYVAVPVELDVLDVLQPAVTGRGAAEPLLERWRYGQAPGGIEWIKHKRGAWLSSSEFNRDWQKIKAQAGLPHADPYAFRHSSIVRKLRQNLSIRHVAALHDTSTIMIERHYSRYIVDGLEELAARAVVPLVPIDGSNVVPISGVRP